MASTSSTTSVSSANISRSSKGSLIPGLGNDSLAKTHNSAYDTMPHKYYEIQNRYTQAIVSGRHPISFKRNSELWHHFHNSNARTDRISKGHTVWKTIEEEDAKIKSDASEHDLRPRGQTAQSGLFNKRTKANVINDVQIDSKNLIHLHYGMSIVVMNYLDEVLVATKFNELKCKDREKILPTDKIVFKIIDIEDPTNPSAIYLGDQLWLQCLDYDEMSEVDDSFEKGMVLGSKLFSPPEMKVVKLDLAWSSHNTNNAPTSPNPIATDINGREFTSAFGSNPKPVTPNPSTVPAQSNSSTTAPISHEAPQKSNSNNSLPSSPTIEDKSNEKGSDNNDESEGSEKKGKLSDIVGGAQLVSMCDTVKVESSDGLGEAHKITSKYIGKTSLNSGRWVPIDACRKPADEKKPTSFENPDSTTNPKAKKKGHDGTKANVPEDKRDKLMSLSPVYLEQDLYVLGSTHGTTHQPWPKFSLDFVDVSVLRAPKKSALELSAVSEDGRPGTPNSEPDLHRPNTADAVSNMTGGESVTRRFNITKSGDHLDPAPHLCLRRKVYQAPPYAYLIDRRCVWNFHVVENASTLTGNTKDQIAQRIMIKAKDSLKKSEMQRKGARVHSDVIFEGETLVGGESFSKTLRAVLMQKSLDIEAQAMFERRAKEKDLLKTFEDLYLNSQKDVLESPSASKSKSIGSSSKKASQAFSFGADDSSSLGSFDSSNINFTNNISSTFITGGSRGASPATSILPNKDDVLASGSEASSLTSKSPLKKVVPNSGRMVGSPAVDRKHSLTNNAIGSSTAHSPHHNTHGNTVLTPVSSANRKSKLAFETDDMVKSKSTKGMMASHSDGELLSASQSISSASKKSVRFDPNPISSPSSANQPMKSLIASEQPNQTKGYFSFGSGGSAAIEKLKDFSKSRADIAANSLSISQSIANFSSPKSPIAKNIMENSQVFQGFNNSNLDNLKKPPLLSLESPSNKGLADAGDRFNTPVYCTIPKIHTTYIPGPRSFAGYKEEVEPQKSKSTVNFGINRRKDVEKVDNQEGHSFSQGEKVIALHNSMTTSMENYKAQLEAKKSSTNELISLDSKDINPLSPSTHEDPWQKKERDDNLNSVSRCLRSLASEDKLIDKAISYKDKIEQYKRISQLFSDITF